MSIFEELSKKNVVWAENVKTSDPDFFSRLAAGQSPRYLWIGCSDSRVPASEVMGLKPGELFVHRNIGNIVIHTDLSCLSVIQYAVEVLKINHIILCGHYDCGGIKAAMEKKEHGLIDNWLRHIKDVYRFHEETLDKIEDKQKRFDRLCELNVVEQVSNICHTTIVQNAWKAGHELAVHGWMFSLSDGKIKELGVQVSNLQDISDTYRLE